MFPNFKGLKAKAIGEFTFVIMCHKKYQIFHRNCLEYTYFILLTDTIRFITGPMNAKYCFVKTIWRSSYVTSALLYFDLIALTRYLFIFHLKNPSSFKEDFWIVFVNAWVRGASIIFNVAWFYQAEHQIINYYLCSGIDPTEDFKKPLKLYSTTELGSVLINLLVYVRIKYYKKSHQENAQAGRSVHLKKLFLTDDFKNSIPSLATNLFHLTSLCILVCGSMYLSKVSVSELKDYRNSIFFFYLIGTPLAFAASLSAYFIRNKPLRNASWIHFQDLLSHLQEHLVIPRYKLSCL